MAPDVDPDELGNIIQDIEDDGLGLTPWEEEFVESVREQLEARGTLTERQIKILRRIHEERT